MEVLRSAFKHGVSCEDLVKAFMEYDYEIVEREDPRKVIRLGFDSKGRLLEVGAEITAGRVIVFHAMKARKKYLKRIKQWTL